MDTDEMTEVIMPNFDEIEGDNIAIELNVAQAFIQTPKKRGRKPATDKKELTPEEKKEMMASYYEANKAHRMEYKKAQREAGKAEQDTMVLTIEPIPQFLENGGKKRVTNLDYIRYGGSKRTLTINQPSEKLLNILRAMEYEIEEMIVQA